MGNSNENDNGVENQQFEFITETIKEKPINKKRVLLKILFNILMAVLFGLVACAVFVYFEPMIRERLYPEETKVVTIPEEEEKEKIEEEPVPTPTPVVTKVFETVEKELEVQDYKLLLTKISAIGENAQKSLVSVTGVKSDVDWFQNTYEDNATTAGLILADNGKELLIISYMEPLKNADSIEVMFCNDEIYPGTIKKSDINTGLAVVAVEMESMSQETLDSIEMAELGSTSSQSFVGSPVIAVGNPLGVVKSMVIGQVTSDVYVKDLTDTNIQYFTTDIYGSANASGVILDLSGRVLGFIFQDNSSDMENMIKAYCISDLKDKIEKLSNGQDFAYLGITGTDVPKEASEELGVPQGAYITEVLVDSPAMEQGLQNGDIITKIGTTDITSFADFKDVMLKCQPGDLMMITVKRLGRDEYVEVNYEIKLGVLE